MKYLATDYRTNKTDLQKEKVLKSCCPLQKKKKEYEDIIIRQRRS
jgi:hypothetical protein